LGFGDSDRSPHHYSIQLEVECLHDYIEALHLQQVYLIGHSLGGWVAASYALKQPERVRGLILLAPEGIQPEGKRLSAWWMRSLVARPSLTAGVVRILRPLAKLLGRHRAIDRALARRQLLLNSPTACKILLKRRHSEIQAELLQERLEWLKVPTLILQGENDTPEAIASSRLYAERIPEVQFVTLEHAGNDLPETSPDWVARHVREFVIGH
jgi:pimeloyl-ACP methyl ester carboxylesterase